MLADTSGGYFYGSMTLYTCKDRAAQCLQRARLAWPGGAKWLDLAEVEIDTSAPDSEGE